MMSEPTSGRLARLAFSGEELELLGLAVAAALASGPSPVYEAIDEKVTAQAGLRFASVRFSNDELKALGSAFKQVLDELKRWDGAAKDPGLRDLLVERQPELSDSPEAAALLAQKVQALRVRTGRQKGWTKPG